MRVKICGVTSVESALAAARAGADAIGLNFVSGPRRIEPELAGDILQAIPPFVTPVALVRLEMGRLPDDLLEFLGQCWVSHIQVYGEVSSGSLALLTQDGFKPMPVVPVRDEQFADEVNNWLSAMGGRLPYAIVLDTHHPDQLGGTGQSFEWNWLRQAAEAGKLAGWPPIILAGGLNPDNVVEAITTARPYGVDVSSGVEVPGRPGVKDFEKMQQFVRRAKCESL
ncbi:MAG TPA: phosphoribosylanthranilate isomerase [Phycisphaerae bacterium]|nr:phosphoribosylanthranilate isomerase [Phycisphaerae bacterium]HPP25542.1 phosphoribosylanthranilate isomerase [Phycisphaerae bacterium]HPZ99016.1 phosphoribosylanthranilate isomerase [Phycisphaerae bacterium]